MLTISAVLPVRNEQSTIAECVRSLLNQVIPVELIIIDDGSTDATPEILETFKEQIEDTGGKLILHSKSLGAAFRRNEGNKLATSDIIMVCDSDLYTKHRSEAAQELFTKYPHKGVMYSAYSIRSAENLFIKQEVPVVVWDFESKTTISHPTVAYRREVALAHPYHVKTKDSDLFEFMLLDMHNAGIEFAACENVLLQKIEGNTNRNRKKAAKIKEKMYKEYGIQVSL